MNTIYGDAPGITRKAYYTGRQVGTTFLRPDHLRTINDTRPIVDYDLAIGDIVQFDPFSPLPSGTQDGAANATTQAGLNATKYLGGCVGAPNIGSAYRAVNATAAVTSIGANIVVAPADAVATPVFQPRLFVVTHVHPNINLRSDPNNANANLARQRDGGYVDICPVGVTDALFFKNTDVVVPAGTLLGLYQPATSNPAIGGLFLYGSGTANIGKPALTNMLAIDMTRLGASATIAGIMESIHRIQGQIMESVSDNAGGGGLASTTSLRKVAIGGGLQFCL